MAPKAYRFSLVEGHPVGSRAIGFLEEILENETDIPSLNAKLKFDSLKPPKDRDVRRRFDLWLICRRNDNWFHGWPNDLSVKECFSFRWQEKGRHHRFYGFLYHPQPKTNPARQICVLTYHDVKNDWNTDRILLIRSMNLRNSQLVRDSISFIFQDESSPQGKRQIQ